MYRYLSLIALLFALASVLPAQDAEEEDSVDLAIAFPATTMVYLRVDTDDYFEALNPEEIFAGLEQADIGTPDLGQIAKERLELPLTDEEVKALASGVNGTGMGLLDITVSGPKYQIVFEHKDLSALERALKQARKDDAVTVPGVEDYYGTDIYEIYLPLAPIDEDDNDPWGVNNSNPIEEWSQIQDYWAAIMDGKYLVLSTNENAVKDAIDYLAFPDDPIDTLLGNGRYREAIADFMDPQAVFFVNVQSVISAMERLAGDQGSGGVFGMILSEWLRGGGEAAQFFVDLLQYEQFKSFAAGLWIDEESLTMRMDANLVFHNAPAWFDAVKIEPQEMPLTDYIPSDSMIALTDCIGDVHELYKGVQDFFIARARNAGQDELADMWLDAEKELDDDRTSIAEMLSHLGGGQAMVVIPTGENSDMFYDGPAVWTVGLLGLKDFEAAQEYFYGKLINSRLGEMFREAESANSPVEVYKGVEIHMTETGEWGFALMPRDDGTGVFAMGEVPGLKRIIEAKVDGSNLKSLPSWQDAKGLLWDKGSLHMYINFGSLIGTGISRLFTMNAFWFDMDEGDSNFDRDDTERDDDPTEFLSEFFRNTVIVGSARSAERSVNIRVAAAGWPDGERLRQLALHFRDVERNQQVRDDFVRVRDAARTYYALEAKPAKSVSELEEAGLIADEEWTIDPYVTPDAEPRKYALAEVPEDVDIRQAILLAYQAEPGLRGNHLAILWNSHVVEMTPEQLKKALELAKEGKQLPEEKDENGVTWYSDTLKPIFKLSDPRVVVEEPWWEEDDTVEVEIIDDDGDEQKAEVDKDNVLEETEKILEQQDAAGAED